MYLDKVIDLEQIKLGKNQVLVELIRRKYKSSLIIEGSENNEDEIIKELVIRSEYEGVNEGDVILDARYALGQNGMLKQGDRTFVIAMGHDIKLWTSSDNYDETKEPVKKDSIITKKNKVFSSAELKKIEGAARGLKSSAIDNRP